MAERRICKHCHKGFYPRPQNPDQQYCSERECQRARKRIWQKKKILTQLKCLNLEKPLIVTDNGYYSQKNMMEFALRNVKFLTLVDPNIIWVRETVDALRATLAGMSSTCPFDPSICGATSPRMHQFTRARQRSRNGKIAGENETISRRLYVHVYYSPDNEAKKEIAFRMNPKFPSYCNEDGGFTPNLV